MSYSQLNGAQPSYALIATTLLKYAPVRINVTEHFGIMATNTGRVKGNTQIVLRKNLNFGSSSAHFGVGTNEVADSMPKISYDVYNVESIKTNVVVPINETVQFEAAEMQALGYSINPFIQAFISAQIDINQKLERTVYLGNPNYNVKGFLNNPNTSNTVSTTPFNTATPQQIYDQLKILVTAVNVSTGYRGAVFIGFPMIMGDYLESFVTVTVGSSSTTIAQKLGEALLKLQNVDRLIPVAPQYMILNNGNLCWYACSAENRNIGLALDRTQISEAMKGVQIFKEQLISPQALSSQSGLDVDYVKASLREGSSALMSEAGFKNFDDSTYPNNLVAIDFMGFDRNLMIAGGAYVGQASLWTGGGIVAFKGMFQTIDTQVPFAGSTSFVLENGETISDGAVFSLESKDRTIESHIKSIKEVLSSDKVDEKVKKDYAKALENILSQSQNKTSNQSNDKKKSPNKGKNTEAVKHEAPLEETPSQEIQE